MKFPFKKIASKMLFEKPYVQFERYKGKILHLLLYLHQQA